MTAVKLHYTAEGQGKPVIILHGLFGSARNWSGISRQLARDFQVISVDLRNHGASAHAATMTYPEMAEDIVAVMAEARLDQAAILGHSLGGKVAMTLALKYGNKVEKLAVLDIAPVSYNNNLIYLVDAMERLPLAQISRRSQADALLQQDIPATALRRFMLQNLVQTDAVFHWRINLAAIRANLAASSAFPDPGDSARYAGPVLFLGGADSDYIQPAHRPAIRRYFPQADIQFVEGAGHWLHADQPQAVVSILKTFLDT